MPAETGDIEQLRCRLGELLEARGRTLAELSREIGVTHANLSVLKNNRAKAIRFTTLVAICRALDCQPGDLFVLDPADAPEV